MLSLVLAGPLWACSRSGSDEGGLRIQVRGIEHRVAELRLDLPRGRFYEGEKIVATFVLRNRAEHPLWVNKRLAFNDKTVPAELRDIWIEVKSLEAPEVHPDCVGRALPAKESDYVVLPAGDAISSRETITCLNLSVGRYLLIAHYRDANLRPPYAPDGLAWLGEEVLSAPAALEIVKKPG